MQRNYNLNVHWDDHFETSCPRLAEVFWEAEYYGPSKRNDFTVTIREMSDLLFRDNAVTTLCCRFRPRDVCEEFFLGYTLWHLGEKK